VAPDGQSIAISSGDDPVFLWKRPFNSPGLNQTDAHIRTCRQDKDPECLAFNHRGDLLATGGDGQTLRFVDPRSGETRATWFAGCTREIALTPDDQFVIAGNTGGYVRLWDVASRTCTALFQGSENAIDPLAVSPDGQLGAAGSWDGNVYLWDLAKPQVRVSLPSHRDNSKVAYLPASGTQVAAREKDGSVCCLDWKRQVWRKNLQLPKGDWIESGSTGDLKQWAFLDTALSLFLWHSTQGSPPRQVALPQSISGLPVFSPDGHYFVAASLSGALLICKLDTLDFQIRKLDPVGRPLTLRVQFSPDGALLVLHRENAPMEVLDFPSGKLRYTGSGTPIAFSPDGTLLAVGTDFHSVQILDAKTGQKAFEQVSNPSGIRTLAFSPDNRTLVSGGGSKAPLQFWHVPTGQELFTLPMDRSATLMDIAFSPDGRALFVRAEKKQEALCYLWRIDAALKGE
jgi:WD40 repeat protein